MSEFMVDARMRVGLMAWALTGFAGRAAQAAPKRVMISTIVEVPQLIETKDGVIQGLAERGFVDGRDIKVEYLTANGNASTQQQIARKFVGDGADLIVAITTPTAQAMISATSSIPIVFAAVTDPIKAKLIARFNAPGGNITGVSDAPPLTAQLALFREILPNLKKLGFVYNPGLDSSNATLEHLRAEGAKLGVTVTEAAAPTTNEVIPATRKLVGSVDAIYVPNDTTVVAALETVVKIGQETRIPVFAGETRAVDRGALASVGLDYVEVGKAAGRMAAAILGGAKPGDVDAVVAYQTMPNLVVVVNRRAAQAMGVTLPEAVLRKATRTVG
ncbi:ABC transporter substrate-binding protein [Phreatobacter sp. AB_2022a]|uniref:ABC transporter substrate-binding protein n=1 Tax=Phreatobacter sp. AB_2022a TaxID=3003134 RepID=UPI0022873237|nr:ABC transporter substrate-binding protein [Phreatobacter sp. AB_2022a]MCZ0736323.1 ABC transporter substrate-binding protein [Phreatobacter sp. AB_2022a]